MYSAHIVEFHDAQSVVLIRGLYGKQIIKKTIPFKKSEYKFVITISVRAALIRRIWAVVRISIIRVIAVAGVVRSKHEV